MRTLLASLILLMAACDGSIGAANGDGGANPGPDGAPGPCVGLACFQVDCGQPGLTTTLSGTVYAPNGMLPLYNVNVYVPNGTVDPIVNELSCDRCDAVLSGDPLVKTITDTEGKFVLENVPATAMVPVVIQVGKWRRQIEVPNVPQCVDTELTVEQSRLPKNQGEGDIPRMALTTGGADALECLLRKIGLEDSEFTVAGGSGRVHLYAGGAGADKISGGGNMAGAQPMWSSLDELKKYDVVFLSCEGGQNPDTKPAGALQAMHDYAGMGGRVFASHWHNYWIQSGPTPWPDTVDFNFQDDLNDIEADIDTGFDSSAALAQWLVNVGGSTTLGKIALTATQHTIVAVDTTLAYRWIYQDATANGTPSVQYVSFTTPLTVEEDLRCGKVVLSDIHVSSGDKSEPAVAFPGGCTSNGLTPQEKTLVFMIFDLASCVGPVVD